MGAWLRSTLRGAVAVVAVCLLVRTWVVMGLIVPMEVSGSSMAPGLRGLHFQSTCLSCGSVADHSAESSVSTERFPCPACGEAGSVVLGPVLSADRLWVSRLGKPRRWDAVVAYSPDDPGLCVKRLVGLPGEEVSLVKGDVRINGQVVYKSLGEQRAVRVRVAAEAEPQTRVVFKPVGQPVFTDDLPYNASLTRQLNAVADLAVSAMVTPGSDILVSVAIGRAAFTLDNARSAHIDTGGAILSSLGRQLPARPFLLEVSTFDRQVLLAVDGEVWIAGPIAGLGPVERVEVAVAGQGSLLKATTLWRDVYYEPPPAHLDQQWTLGPGQVFLLGDNAPVSIDSRRWGPVRRNSIVGRPLGGY